MPLCQHVLVYSRSLGGYTILCKKCGEVRGGSESADPRFLAGLNRNQRKADARKRASSGHKGRRVVNR